MRSRMATASRTARLEDRGRVGVVEEDHEAVAGEAPTVAKLLISGPTASWNSEGGHHLLGSTSSAKAVNPRRSQKSGHLTAMALRTIAEADNTRSAT